jgi:hypothetical protein
VNPKSGNQPHQGHHPHPEALDVNEPDEAVSALDKPVGDALVSPVIDPTKSGAQGEPTTDYAEDL